MADMKNRKIKKTAAVFLSLMMIFLSTVTGNASVIKNKYGGVSQGPSSSGNMRIYVSKKNRTLTLYDVDAKVAEWPCNIGTYSDEGDKKVEGDSTTPSGKFYVCTRNDKSVCYLALGVSYPSVDDAERGLRAGLITENQYTAIRKAAALKQQPPWDTALGGTIEIHGGYAEGAATHGCVAVDNSVMDILWDKCAMGTTIQIGP